MTVTFNVTATAADGGGGTANNSNGSGNANGNGNGNNNNNQNNNNNSNNNDNNVVLAFGGRRVLAAKTDSLSNVVNNVAANRNNSSRRSANGTLVAKEAVMSVRRVLFGPPENPAVTRAWLERQLYVVAAKNSRSYNFDFSNERPMVDRPNNRYAWERVRKPVVVAPPPTPQPQVAEEPAEPVVVKVEEVPTTTEECSRTSKQQFQSKLTDFIKSKKRPLDSSTEALCSNKAAAAAAAAEEELASQSANKRSRLSVATVV